MMAETLEKAVRQPHVLLAEGDEGTALAVRSLLQRCGYRGEGSTPLTQTRCVPS